MKNENLYWDHTMKFLRKFIEKEVAKQLEEQVDFLIKYRIPKHITDYNKGGFSTDYLTQKQVCEEFNISKTTLYRYRITGELPVANKKGKKLYYSRPDLEKFFFKESNKKSKS
jgi:hypothetical protein